MYVLQTWHDADVPHRQAEKGQGSYAGTLRYCKVRKLELPDRTLVSVKVNP